MTKFINSLKLTILLISFFGSFLHYTAIAKPIHVVGKFQQKNINDVGWFVSYLGREYNATTDTTTFSYEVTVTPWEKDLSHWVLGDIYASDNPTSNQAPTELGYDPTTGIDGFKWDRGQAKGTIMVYTITVDGHIGETGVDYSVKGGRYYAIGGITGPGDEIIVEPPPSYNISGLVYLVTGPSEDPSIIIGNPLSPVTVALYDTANNLAATTLTDAAGDFILPGIPPGDYMIIVPGTTANSSDLNEFILSTYQPLSAVSLSISINDSNISGIQFLFKPASTGDGGG